MTANRCRIWRQHPLPDTHPNCGYHHRAFGLNPTLMPIDRKRYPDNWIKIAEYAKEAAGWRCQHCQRLCLRPGEKPPHLTRSEWTKATLSTHHANFTPEDNQPENLIPLCSPCHLALHSRSKRSNVSPGQLSLW